MLSWDSIEGAFEPFLELVREDERVRAEFERSRAEFFAEPAAVRGPGAELRHLEWFLLERPSAVLGAVPAVAWQAQWRARLGGTAGELGTAFQQSMPGAFEVTSIVPSEGLWVRDLFTLGEHPVTEALATAALASGDLLVGRLYPGSAGVFLLSPAVAVFRNPELLAAVRTDLARMRSARRGVLRVQQLELEHLFHGPGSVPEMAPAPAEVRVRVRTQLEALGLAPAEVERLLERVRHAAHGGDGREITEILNGLAFDTGIDLSSARLVLVELWEAERGPRGDSPAPAARTAEDGLDPHSALEAFDRGRAEGRDLEQLFQQLERDLGVLDDDDAGEEEDEPDESEDDAGAAEFPGLVGALVDEFLWEIELEQGVEETRPWGVLRALGRYGRDLGILEDLDRTRLLDFSARWLLDEAEITDAGELATLFAALAAFCRWCEEQHDLPLAKSFGSTLEGLSTSVPRHLRLRQAGNAGAGLGAYRVTSVRPREASASDRGGNERVFALNERQAAELREGDLVRLARKGERDVLGASYPAELGEMLF
jgi:hypothetical protein